jgi:medium-chain acyl-[acyl-carrier-protein] hydrolase
MDVIVNSISKEMKDYLDIPYVFFGHSMGALISFEIAHKVKIMYNSQPHKLYISSHRVPSFKRESKIIHSLEDAELKSELIRMNGMNKEIYENDELMEIFLPIIRNDYRLCETYEYSEREKLGCKITVLGGNSDYDIGEEHLKQWSNFTNSKFHLQMFEGDHFFLLKNQTEFIRQFVEWLNEDVNSVRSL